MKHALPIAATLTNLLGGHWHVNALGASGFCDTWQAQRGQQKLFLKSSRGGSAAMLQAEADGLQALAATRTIRVPAVVAQGEIAPGQDLLALEWLDLQPRAESVASHFGELLASLHQSPCPLQPPAFGWRRDNFIGATPQSNAPTGDASPDAWIAFMRTQRIGAMRARLVASGKLDPAFDDAIAGACENLPLLFADGYQPQPSLIHGDLWSGNWGLLADGQPVIFDPAVSCSDREAELAMMELFGAPAAGFWRTYRDRAGLHPGYARRRALYQLYHLLNHVVLFGAAYSAQALAVARSIASL